MKKIITSLAILAFYNFIFAQYPNWQQYSAGDNVLCQAFEGEETLWVGTFNGLFKLNTVTGEVETFNTANSPLTSNLIRSLVVDENNNKWVGTWSDGLLKFDDTSWTIYDTAYLGLHSMGIKDLAIDSSGRIWMVVYNLGVQYGAGIICYDGYEWIFYNSQNSGLPGTSYNCIYIDNFDTVWIGCYYEGLVKFDGSDWTVYNTANSGMPDDHVYSLFIDADNNKWVGTSDGLARFDGLSWTVFDTANSELPYPVIRSINKDDDNTLWIGCHTFNSGGYSYSSLVTLQNDSIWDIYTINNSGLPSNSVYQITVNQNNKWFGTAKGVVRFDNSEWINYELGCGLPEEEVTSIAIGDNNIKWVATSSGLSKFNDNEWVLYNSDNSQLPVNSIKSIEVDSNNVVYVNTNGGGLVVINNDEWTIFNSINSGLPNDTVYCSTIDKNGVLYVGTNNGLAIFDYNEWIVYDTANSGLPYNQIKGIVIDNDNIIWLISGQNIRRVVSFDGNEWVIQNEENGLPIWAFPYSLAVDYDNRIWLGTSQWGIYSFDGTTWSYQPELPSFLIQDIQVDENNTKWFVAIEGLAKYNSENDYFVYTTDNSGLSGKWVNTVAIDTNNTIWCGTRFNGISAYNENGFASIGNNTIETNIEFITNYPNPFISKTNIQINMPDESFVSVNVYSLSGILVNQIYKGNMKRGLNTFIWDGDDSDGSIVSQGIYIISVSTNSRYISAKRIIKL